MGADCRGLRRVEQTQQPSRDEYPAIPETWNGERIDYAAIGMAYGRDGYAPPVQAQGRGAGQVRAGGPLGGVLQDGAHEPCDDCALPP